MRTSSRAAVPPSRYGPCWQRPWCLPGGCTPGSSCARTCRRSRAARSTWTRRNTSCVRGTGRRPSAKAARIAPLITTLNRIRRRHPALQQLRDIHFHHADNDAVIAYSKRSGSNIVLVVVNLDPHHTQEATVSLDMPRLGLEWHETVPVRDELTGETYHWGRANYVRLEPGVTPAHIVRPATVPADRRVTHTMIVNEPVQDTFEDTPAKDRDPDWFKRAVFYEVLVRSFQDSNGDGIGDLKGITAKLDYLQWLGVDCLWLPPFFKSPLRDGGYDVSDYTAVLPEFGDLADFVEFVDAAHQRGMRVIIDFVMNHTSDQHDWFQESRKDPDGPYGDYYVWADDDKQFQDARIIFVDTGDVQLDLRPGPQAVLLAPLLHPPAGSQLREPEGAGGDHLRPALLAGPGHRRLPPRRRALPVPAGGHQLRKPSCDPRVPQAGTQGDRRAAIPTRSCSRRPTSGPRTSSTTSATTGRRRRVPHGVPLPRDATHLHGRTA